MQPGTAMIPNAVIAPAGAADFATIAALAEAIWREHYPAMISMAQIDYMLAGRYAPERLLRYVNVADCGLAVLRVSNEPVGYCSYARTDAPHEMKLEQLYLLAKCRGQGLGGLMLRYVEARARNSACRVLCLTVNKANADSIAIYRKSGFTVRGEAIVDIGHGYVMDDYVMEKTLG
jgi:ribosomal protein S18 acetylase RimI-like enzyme